MVLKKNYAFIRGQSYWLSYYANETGAIYLSNVVNAKMDMDEYCDRKWMNSVDENWGQSRSFGGEMQPKTKTTTKIHHQINEAKLHKFGADDRNASTLMQANPNRRVLHCCKG